MSLTFEFDKSSMAEFQRSLNALEAQTNRKTKSLVKLGARKFLVSARARTKKAPKKIKRPHWGRVGEKEFEYKYPQNYRFWVDKYNKDNKLERQYARTRASLEKKRIIPYSGLGRASWAAMMKHVGSRVALIASAKIKKVANSKTKVREGGKAFSYFLELTNFLDYAAIMLTHSSMNEALRKAAASIRGEWRKKGVKF